MKLFSGVDEIVNTTVQTRDGGVACWAHSASARLWLICLFRNRRAKQRVWKRAHASTRHKAELSPKSNLKGVTNIK